MHSHRPGSLKELPAFRAPKKPKPGAEQTVGNQLPGRQQPRHPPLRRSGGDAAAQAAPPAWFCPVLLCEKVTHQEHRTAELISALNLPLKFICSKLFIKSIVQVFHISLFLLAHFSSARGNFSLVFLVAVLCTRDRRVT